MKSFGNILIIGDSYSTFKDYIPEGYSFWYPNEGDPSVTDVSKVQDTWWYKLCEMTNSKIVLNNSYSGTTICSTERPGMPNTYFNFRLDKLNKDGFFDNNKIDTVFVFGGTNDSWINSPIGEIRYDDLKSCDPEILPAFSRLLATIKKILPNALIIPLINCDLKEKVMNGLEEISRHYNITPVRLKGIDKLSGHPSCKGMTEIAKQIIDVFN